MEINKGVAEIREIVTLYTPGVRQCIPYEDAIFLLSQIDLLTSRVRELEEENRRMREAVAGILNHYPLMCVCSFKTVECFPCKARRAVLTQAAKKEGE